MNIDPSLAFQVKSEDEFAPTGQEPSLGGELREKAVWVDESSCIGCRYCGNVASNTFGMEDRHGRARVMRQDGDSAEIIGEAIDTCPVNCIHWVEFEDLDRLREQLEKMDIQSLGMQPKVRRRFNP